MKLTVKLAVAFAPEKLLSENDQSMQRRDHAAAFLAVGEACTGTEPGPTAGLSYIDLTVNSVGLARQQTIRGLSRIGPPQEVSWFRDYMTIRIGGVPARTAATSRGLSSVSPQAEVPREADPDTHPFHVALLHVNEPAFNDAIICSGALVAERFVVTIAFCVDTFEDPEKNLNILVTRRTDGSGQRHKVKRVILHPQYDWAFITSVKVPDYDIAVIELATPVTGVPLAPLAAALPPAGTLLRKISYDTLVEPTGKLLQGNEVLFPTVNGMCGQEEIPSRSFCTQPQAGQAFFGWELSSVLTIGGRPGVSQLVGLNTMCNSPGPTCPLNYYVNIANSSIRSFVLDTIAAGDRRIGFAAPIRYTTEAGDDQPPPVASNPRSPAWHAALSAALARGNTTVWVVRAFRARARRP